MKKGKLKQLNILTIIIILAAIVCGCIFAFGFNTESKNKLNYDSLKEYNEGWVLKQYRDEPDKIINLPDKLKADKGELIVLMNRVPEDVDASTVLVFETNFQNAMVVVDSKTVYVNGYFDDRKLMKNAVPCTNIADIGCAKKGDIITLYLVSGYSGYSGEIPSIYYGTRGDVVSSVIRKNAVAFVGAITLIAITLILLVLTIALKKVSVNKQKAFYAFGFIIATSCWLLLGNPIMQLITDKIFAVYMIDMLLLLILPILYIMYQRCFAVKKRYALIFEAGIYIYAINFITGVVFQLLSVCDFASYIKFTKLLILIGLILLSGVMYLAADTFADKTIYNNFFVNVVITVACLLEAILSLFGFYKLYDGMMLQIGIYLFVVLFAITVQKGIISEMNKERETVKQGAKLERNDVISRINSNVIYSSLNVVINNLKKTDLEDSRHIYDTSIYMKHNMNVIVENGLVSFEQELEYIRAYLGMMSRQHTELSVSIDDVVTDFMVPYNSIEPLVENAVTNGALLAPSGGRIAIRSYERLDCYAIQIVDNGPVTVQNKKASSRIDITTIKKRLRDMCGATIEVKSKPERGTILTVKLPKSGYVIKE